MSAIGRAIRSLADAASAVELNVPVVYFIQASDGPVKIGLSTRGGLSTRRASLRTANARRLSLVAWTSPDRIAA